MLNLNHGFPMLTERETRTINRLLKECQRPLGAHCRRLTNNTDEAEELMQLVRIKVFKEFHRIQDKTKFQNWLHKTVKTTYVDMVRAYRAFKKMPEDSIGYIHEKYGLDHDPFFRHIPIDRQMEICGVVKSYQDVMNQLPKAVRNALIARYEYHELPDSEIAAMVGVKPNTFKASLYRGRIEMNRRCDPNELLELVR
jgi:RNA polymerase sigma-70 factor, ECF subfamily